MINAKFEKDPIRNGRVIHVWRGSIKKQDKHKHKNKKTKLAMQ